ncbi:MAG: FlgD immunoglobulin-like domain containing protein [Elusimicrobiota bacterium]
MIRFIGALALLGLLTTAASAIKPGPGARADAKRFGFNRLRPATLNSPSTQSKKAFAAFNAAQGGRWNMRFNPRTGLPSALSGGRDYPRSGTPDEGARSFLSAHQDMLGVDAATLQLDRHVQATGHQHLLYRQSYRGIPVEFAAVKVHMDPNGAVMAVNSSFEPNLNLPTVPAVASDAAGRAAAADAGGGVVQGAPALVIVPLETDGRNHLAWKMRVAGTNGSWRYYVDAITGQVLFRYSVDRFISCLSSGVVTGMVYDQDPNVGPMVSRPFNNQYVYVSAPPVQVVTATDPTYGGGFFCSATPGKVSMSLQGPYVSVAQTRGAGAHYDNGSGVWNTVATPVSSPHPYAANSVSVSTIDLSGIPGVVSFLPIFSDFHVGRFDGGSGEGSGDIVQDDQLFVYDGNNNAVGTYIGDRAPFHGAEVHSTKMHLALRALSGGTNSGYDIAISSYLTLSSPGTDGAPKSSHTWVNADTAENLHSEISLFYHLNKMHDYFVGDVDSHGDAPLVKPVVAMAHFGPNLLNAFYDPDYDALYFGDVSSLAPSDAFTDDATVPHHEYVHYVVEKIWSIQNFGQAGAISEANADYFSASSLNDSSIGVYVVGALGGSGALRELDTTKPGAVNFSLCDPTATPGCATPWLGEIHDDSPFISQALWDIRRNRIATLGYTNGRSCADNLEFQALLFFPESFSELYEAMLKVDQMGIIPACGAANASQAIISQAFGSHVGLLISAGRGDAYEPNDGFETANDISTIPAISATISPAADTDFYSFGAGPGLIQVTMALPSSGGGLYKAYQLKLYNASRVQVAGAAPPYNGFGTLDGICDANDCNTTAHSVTLSYNNPTGGLMYVQVIGGDSLNGSSSGVNSTVPYALNVAFPKTAAIGGSVVSAHFDKDVIGFTVNTSSFVSRQDWSFASAQLRDQGFATMANTLTHVPTSVGDFLQFVSSRNAFGQITGSVQLSTGFATRFPSVGTVYLEVFATDAMGGTSSMGLSNPMNLSASSTELTAYNNLFTPAQGQKATVKYAVNGSGHLTVKLYTGTGRYVATLFDGDVAAGKGSVNWDGHNAGGNVVASGVYVVKAVGPGLNSTQKIVVVK